MENEYDKDEFSDLSEEEYRSLRTTILITGGLVLFAFGSMVWCAWRLLGALFEGAF